MADIVADAKRHPRVEAVVPLVPGQRNEVDELSTPDGVLMEPAFDEIDAETARREVEAGALVVWGGCGCGPTDCGELEWPDPALVRGATPTFGRDGGWLSLWKAGQARVVFVHGSVTWGGYAPGASVGA